MERYLPIFIVIPLIGFIINALADPKNERLMARASYYTMVTQFLLTLIFISFWAYNKHAIVGDLKLVDSHDVHFFFDYCFNGITAVYLLVGSFLSFLIIAFSRTYLHREDGFKRFFTTIMLFYLAYNILVLSGNLATLFIGWEIAGVSSFLLIGYYRDRYIPVKNAVKVFSLYRIGDMALILALWMSHHFYDHQIFSSEFDSEHPLKLHANHNWVLFFSFMIVIAASIKSAQFPFSSWLPRAMEGPTPSSAIFYSSLSAHLGVLLLLRTYNFWEHNNVVKAVIITIGSVTFLISSLISMVQPSAKGQIAYAASAQIGLMFIETALGWHTLVLIHFAGNAFLRSYQLLISPSLVTYKIREQFYEFQENKKPLKHNGFSKIKNTLYSLAMQEFFMEPLLHRGYWHLFKQIGKSLRFIPMGIFFISGVAIFSVISLLQFVIVDTHHLNSNVIIYITLVYTLAAALKLFAEKQHVFNTWTLIAFVHIGLLFSLFLLSHNDWVNSALYASGILLAYVIGYLALRNLKKLGENLTLDWYQGIAYEHPKTNIMFLLSSLGMIGFPITSAFLGIENMLGHIEVKQIIILALIAITLLVNSLSIIRMYSRIFLGPHVKNNHETAFRWA